MSSERYDVVLKALNGPLASMGEQKFQGPMVRIGANPGPGGMALNGYRGIDARQAVITAYSEGEATVGPVGTNQVRLAPHANVDWKAIDPLTGPEYLNKGAAIHLGPVGRGATVEFVRVEKLGVWTQGRVGSAVDSVKSVSVSAPVSGARKAAPQRSVARIAAATLPIWIVGCLGLFVAVVAAGVLIAVYVGGPVIEKLGPTVEGEEFYEEIGDPKKALETIDEKDRLYRYSIVSGPLPVANYTATLRVRDDGKGQALVEWSSEFDPAAGAPEMDAIKTVQNVYQTGFDNLKKMFGM